METYYLLLTLLAPEHYRSSQLQIQCSRHLYPGLSLLVFPLLQACLLPINGLLFLVEQDF